MYTGDLQAQQIWNYSLQEGNIYGKCLNAKSECPSRYRTIVCFFKVAPHFKIQFESNMRLNWRFTGKTDEINLTHFTING